MYIKFQNALIYGVRSKGVSLWAGNNCKGHEGVLVLLVILFIDLHIDYTGMFT